MCRKGDGELKLRPMVRRSSEFSPERFATNLSKATDFPLAR
ncbi:MAG: hypothetical protein ACK5O1_06495 [Holosporales bacterium]